jgi:hypothetical protein
MSTNFSQLPKDLPVPIDDGAAAHLVGSELPNVSLVSTNGTNINIRELTGRWVIYVYPMTGRPGVPLPDGWDGIPGARGCTPQLKKGAVLRKVTFIAKSKLLQFSESIKNGPLASETIVQQKRHNPMLNSARLKRDCWEKPLSDILSTTRKPI